MTVHGYKDLFECGVSTTSGICYQGCEYSPKVIIKQLTSYEKKWAFYVFADAQRKDPKNTFGIQLRKYIEDNNLGFIMESEGWHFNEAHGPRYIKIYVWRPDYDEVKKHFEKQDVKVKKSMLEI